MFVAIDAETKLVPVFHIGKRHYDDTRTFLWDLYTCIEGRTQITTMASITTALVYLKRSA